VTLQPITLGSGCCNHFAILPLEGMGLELDFVKGEGPVIYNPLQTLDDVRKLRITPPEESLWFTLEAIKLARTELDARGIPLIGFSGAPYTLASYAIEGASSRNFLHTKALMMSDSAAWHLLMEKLSEVVGHYLLAQARAGSQVLQLFDSWVGSLSPDDYRQHVMPYSRHALEIASQAGVPIIHFGTGTNGMLELIQDAGGDDQHRLVHRLDVAWNRIDKQRLKISTQRLLAPGNAQSTGLHILISIETTRSYFQFRAWHLAGNLWTTKRLAEFVHEYTRLTPTALQVPERVRPCRRRWHHWIERRMVSSAGSRSAEVGKLYHLGAVRSLGWQGSNRTGQIMG
jgi:uroporphyrinogen decarboxylase